MVTTRRKVSPFEETVKMFSKELEKEEGETLTLFIFKAFKV